MSEVRVVEVVLPNGATALVRATDLDADAQVAQKVGWKDILSFEGVSGTLEGIAQAVRSGLEKATPSKTTVELGIELAVKSGKLTGLIVEGDADASLKVTLEWGGQAEDDPCHEGSPNPLIALFRQCVVCITDEAGRVPRLWVLRGAGPGGHLRARRPRRRGAAAAVARTRLRRRPGSRRCRRWSRWPTRRATRCRTWRSSTSMRRRVGSSVRRADGRVSRRWAGRGTGCTWPGTRSSTPPGAGADRGDDRVRVADHRGRTRRSTS